MATAIVQEIRYVRIAPAASDSAQILIRLFEHCRFEDGCLIAAIVRWEGQSPAAAPVITCRWDLDHPAISQNSPGWAVSESWDRYFLSQSDNCNNSTTSAPNAVQKVRSTRTAELCASSTRRLEAYANQSFQATRNLRLDRLDQRRRRVRRIPRNLLHRRLQRCMCPAHLLRVGR